MMVQPGTLEQFKDWLDGLGSDGRELTLEDYERKGFPAIREAYQSRDHEVTGNAGMTSFD
jgi:hypothetical protein